jgi:hypothetical protein
MQSDFFSKDEIIQKIIFVLLVCVAVVILLPVVLLLFIAWNDDIKMSEEEMFNANEGYYSVHGFEDAKRIAAEIISKHLNADECLKIRYVKSRIGLPDYLTDQNMQDTCFQFIAASAQDPMACAKIELKGRSVDCLAQIVIRSEDAYDEWFEEPTYLCSYAEGTTMLTCYYHHEPTKPIEIQSLDNCKEFTLLQAREWCAQKRAIRNRDISACDLLTIDPLRQNCYLALDTTCEKLSNPLLHQICEAMNTMRLPTIERTILRDTTP